ncbi:MAG: PaaI family thioesterase [Desulfarculaceae bacterium]|nr:PaaI family thioesterase [Desulfarculaceae bacterium]MCF8071218.1 PaaI family thioesterase [Desulfarculaceae bacterium]MCF8101179.1 PaaI family thioesterase [Desulfarculaceae bacterium]MCF8115272.1 PaaI family thioesterase [Desulfarculaceae bacterium]
MSELDKRLAYAREAVGGDPWARFLGLKVEELSEARASISFVPGQNHLNAVGRAHGSVLYALADQAMAVAANTLERPALVVEARISFVGKAEPGVKLVAEARALDLGRTLSLWEVRITDPDGRLVALAGGRGYHAAPRA